MMSGACGSLDSTENVLVGTLQAQLSIECARSAHPRGLSGATRGVVRLWGHVQRRFAWDAAIDSLVLHCSDNM